MNQGTIITAALGYTGDRIRPFLESAMNVGIKDIMIIGYQGFTVPCGLPGKVFVVSDDGNQPASGRYHATVTALNLLHADPQMADRKTLWLDSRDVLFRANPFIDEFWPDYPLFATAEAGRIRDDDTNWRWLDRLTDGCCGRGMAKRPILCAGVFGGAFAVVMRHLSGIKTLCIGQDWFGADQAAHNLLCAIRRVPIIEHGKFAWHHVLPQRRGVPLSVATCPIIHQYDREGAPLSSPLWFRPQIARIRSAWWRLARSIQQKKANSAGSQ